MTIKNTVGAFLISSIVAVFPLNALADNPSAVSLPPLRIKIVANEVKGLDPDLYEVEVVVAPDVETGRGFLDPKASNWDGKKTNPGNGYIEHVNLDDLLWTDIETKTTNKANNAMITHIVAHVMVDRYWDEEYYKVGNKHGGPSKATFYKTAIEAPLDKAQFKMNCYGYATGKDYIINPNGYARIVADERTELPSGTLCAAGCVLAPKGQVHAIFIYGCCGIECEGKSTIKGTYEVNGVSALYEGRWLNCDPDPGGMISGVISCKKIARLEQKTSKHRAML